MEDFKSFYVIWRVDEDDFFITELLLDPLMMATGTAKLSNDDIVQMCWDVEYGFDLDNYPNPYVGDNGPTYEMIQIISGENILFHMS